MNTNRKASLTALLVVLAAVLTGGYYLQVKWLSHSSAAAMARPGGTPRKPSAAGKPGGGPIETDNPHGVYYRHRVIVLMYHEVAAKPMDDKALPLDKFKQQLMLMKRNNFHWITMEQYRRFILKDAPVPDNAVLMTFDDGYESYYTDAYPVLRQFHVPATNFLIVNTVGNPHHIGIPKLTWQQVEEMHRNGYDFHNHTFDSHAYASHDGKGGRQLPMLAAPMYLKKLHRSETTKEYLARVKDDLAKADDVLDGKLGNKDHILAFPYGAYSNAVLRLCHKLGIDVTFTVKPGINGYGQRNGYRVNAGGIDDKPVALIDLMKEGTRITKPGSDASRFLLEFGAFSTAILTTVLLKLLVNAWEDKHGRRMLRRRHAKDDRG
ncbi:Peptidoglycan/xylan/chitin deacetylase, PgdA/CDA1 family [Paenibacillus sp. UNC496MF]|uniref:polysaccharide deacetylase family protein n=1 Tax=Paenibacillus sp. UNC496MF TaxID=1502753 RepID=UPI0008EF9D96|nr:polysaccharide deacetylase family protein [Paenibacillus sp. UNC496MF]SFI82001.1 Peptidoglycan/xylan/chitin deacetylase, PgdA/CDA1 family [Paenibacillus sp. UNC496MF]